MNDPIAFHQAKWKGLLRIRCEGWGSTITVKQVDDRVEERAVQMTIVVDLESKGAKLSVY